jgi:hypothetical protein
MAAMKCMSKHRSLKYTYIRHQSGGKVIGEAAVREADDGKSIK